LTISGVQAKGNIVLKAEAGQAHPERLQNAKCKVQNEIHSGASGPANETKHGHYENS
jgi:hypothetical protein